MRISGAQSVNRALDLLSAVIDDGGASTLPSIARAKALPVATAYRLVHSLIGRGYLLAAGGGRFVPGAALAGRTGLMSIRPALTIFGRSVIKNLSHSTGCVAHLGVLEEDMVTYLIKEGPAHEHMFTEEGKQLEAYCSGIGKALLAALPMEQRKAYLATAPFVALTEHTITDQLALDEELQRIAKQGFARDQEEVALGLQCLSVCVFGPKFVPIAAISVSRSSDDENLSETCLLQCLRKASTDLSSKLGFEKAE
jgi:DNA-binding IclR family transcriptional regulator